VAAEPGDVASAAILRPRARTPHHEHVEAAWDREDVTTLLIVVGDINVNLRKIKELLEEDHGEDPEDDA
jgi:hypothetical protein